MKLFGKILAFNKRQTSTNSIIYRDVDKKRNINNTHRQKQTNMLANIFNIYGESRLPENPNELIKQGWNNITHEKINNFCTICKQYIIRTSFMS